MGTFELLHIYCSSNNNNNSKFTKCHTPIKNCYCLNLHVPSGGEFKSPNYYITFNLLIEVKVEAIIA